MATLLNGFTSSYRLASKAFVRTVSLCRPLGVWTPYQPLPEVGIRADPAQTEITHHRWAKIEPTLPSGPLSVLDIGANVGFFSVKMAQRGCFVTSLDNTFYAMLLHHIKTTLGLPNLAATDLYLDPTNIQTLPSYDCTFLLSVFHHWCLSYGSDAALEMLAVVCDRTNRVLYFETGQPDTTGTKYRSRLPEMTPSPLAWLRSHFKSRGVADVQELGYFRGRHLLAIFR